MARTAYKPAVGDEVTVSNCREAWYNGPGYSHLYGGDAWLEVGQVARVVIVGCPAVYAPVVYNAAGKKTYPYGRNPEYCKLSFTAPNGVERDAHAYPQDMTLVRRESAGTLYSRGDYAIRLDEAGAMQVTLYNRTSGKVYESAPVACYARMIEAILTWQADPARAPR